MKSKTELLLKKIYNVCSINPDKKEEEEKYLNQNIWNLNYFDRYSKFPIVIFSNHQIKN